MARLAWFPLNGCSGNVRCVHKHLPFHSFSSLGTGKSLMVPNQVGGLSEAMVHYHNQESLLVKANSVSRDIALQQEHVSNSFFLCFFFTLIFSLQWQKYWKVVFFVHCVSLSQKICQYYGLQSQKTVSMTFFDDLSFFVKLLLKMSSIPRTGTSFWDLKGRPKIFQ